MDAFWKTRIRAEIKGRKWLVAYDAAVPGGAVAHQLLELDARQVLVVAGIRGTGDLPPGIEAHWLDVSVEGGMMAMLRATTQVLTETLPPALHEAVERFDPTHEARVIRPFFADASPVDDRPVWGAREDAWRALEDKTVVDDIWRALGLPCAPSRVMTVAEAAAGTELDEGQGVVWAGDNKSGWHGGASYTRWVRPGAEPPVEYFAEACDTVRVMPFLEGVPCSIHGIVFADHTVVLRPCEMLVFRRPDGSFLYCSAATSWDPSPDGREQMRDMARTTGDWLRATHGYRGVFTIDGVMTPAGFRPTELNPRFGAAIATLAQGLDLPLMLLHFALCEGVGGDWRPAELERQLLAHADAHRRAKPGVVCPNPHDTAALRLLTDPVRIAGAGEPCDYLARIGPYGTGSFLRLEPKRLVPGPALTPQLEPVLAFLDQHWGLGLGPLEAPRG